MLALAVPRFIASIYALYPEAVFDALKDGQKPLSQETYLNSDAALAQALAWFETSDYWHMRATLYLSTPMATQADAKAQWQGQLRQAREATVKGLGLSPVDPFGWLRLATIDNLLQADPRLILQSLRLSIYAGPVEPELLIRRLTLGLIHQKAWDAEMRRLLHAQIGFAWNFRKNELTNFAAAHPGIVMSIRQALGASPEDWTQFQQRFEKLIQQNTRPTPNQPQK